MQIKIGPGIAAIARLGQHESRLPQQMHRGAVVRIDRGPHWRDAALHGEGDEAGEQFLAQPPAPARSLQAIDYLFLASPGRATPAQPISSPLAGSTTAPVP